MKRLLTALLLGLALTACVPQFVGTGPLSVDVTGPDSAVVTLRESMAVFDTVLIINGVLSVDSADLYCEPFEKAWSCELAERVEPPVVLTVRAYAGNPHRISASAWYSVVGQRDRIARATAVP